MVKQAKTNSEVEESDIELRSEDAQEILSMPPGWMLRWGATAIFFIVLLLIFFAWLVRYPDIISGDVKVTTVSPPVQLVSYSSGKISLLNKDDNEGVTKGETIAIIESLLPFETSKALKKYIDDVEKNLEKQGAHLPTADTLYVLGELQTGFDKLISLVKTYNKAVEDPFFQRTFSILNRQAKHYRDLQEMSSSQITLAQQELENVRAKYEANKGLYKEGAISKFDFITEETKYIAAQQQFNDLNKIKIQSSLSLTDCEKQITDLELRRDEKIFQTRYALYEEVNNIKNQLKQWEKKYIIESPVTGTVSYLDTWAAEKYVQQGDKMFTITPDADQYVAVAQVPGLNFGKIKIGQKVSLRMDNYAYNELGEITGIVKSITLAAGIDDKYRVDIGLDNGLVSTYNKKFDYKPEMKGTVQIITEDLSLLDRIFYRFKKLVDR